MSDPQTPARGEADDPCFGERLLKLSRSVGFQWLDQHRDHIQKTPEYAALVELFPRLEAILDEGLEEDPQEFFRTMVHVFQTQAAYNSVLSGDFPESGLSGADLATPHRMARELHYFSPFVMPVILWLHDIGRFQDKRRHTEKSAELICSHGLLEDKGLSEQERVLILKIVEHHLLMGTLYTGESSYMSFELLLKDPAFSTLLADRSWVRLFIESLTLFTMIDVWGYHLRGVSPTSIGDYLEMKREMEQIFAESSDLPGIPKAMRQRSRSQLEWRLMGCMAAFSNIGRQPHLTVDFYREMIMDGFRRYASGQGISADWNGFKDRYLDKLDQVQFKYALGVFVPLTFGGADKIRQPTTDTRMNPDLFHLLAHINRRITLEEQRGLDCIAGAVWDVVFGGYPPWNRKTSFQAALERPGTIEAVVARSRVSTDRTKAVNTLNVDFAGCWEDVQQ